MSWIEYWKWTSDQCQCSKAYSCSLSETKQITLPITGWLENLVILFFFGNMKVYGLQNLGWDMCCPGLEVGNEKYLYGIFSSPFTRSSSPPLLVSSLLSFPSLCVPSLMQLGSLVKRLWASPAGHSGARPTNDLCCILSWIENHALHDSPIAEVFG